MKNIAADTQRRDKIATGPEGSSFNPEEQ